MGIHQETETFRWSEEDKAMFDRTAELLKSSSAILGSEVSRSAVHRAINRIVNHQFFLRDGDPRLAQILEEIQHLRCMTLQDGVVARQGTPKFPPLRVSQGGEYGNGRPKRLGAA